MKVTIGIRVSKEAYEKWKKLDNGTKDFIKQVFERMVLAGGAVPVKIEKRVVVVSTGKRARELEAAIRRVLDKSQHGILAKLPPWAEEELLRALEGTE